MATKVRRAPDLADDERIEQVLSLRAALPEEERVKLDQAVFEARSRRKQKTLLSVPIRVPAQAKRRTRCWPMLGSCR